MEGHHRDAHKTINFLDGMVRWKGMLEWRCHSKFMKTSQSQAALTQFLSQLSFPSSDPPPRFQKTGEKIGGRKGGARDGATRDGARPDGA